MCIPKTATMMMEKVLQPYGGKYHTGKPWHRHPNKIPDKYKDYFVFCTVRNPYSRAISLWFSAIKSYPKFDYCIVKPYGKKLMPFLRMLVSKKVGGNFGGLPMISMSKFLDKVRVNHFLRFENLSEDITTLPFWKGDPPIFRRNVRGHLRPHWSSYFQDPEAVQLVKQWGDKDFEQFGYNEKIPVNNNSVVDKIMNNKSPCVCGSGEQLYKCCGNKQMDQYFTNLNTDEGQ